LDAFRLGAGLVLKTGEGSKIEMAVIAAGGDQTEANYFPR
jgi:hypothetical protein